MREDYTTSNTTTWFLSSCLCAWAASLGRLKSCTFYSTCAVPAGHRAQFHSSSSSRACVLISNWVMHPAETAQGLYIRSATFHSTYLGQNKVLEDAIITKRVAFQKTKMIERNVTEERMAASVPYASPAKGDIWGALVRFWLVRHSCGIPAGWYSFLTSHCCAAIREDCFLLDSSFVGSGPCFVKRMFVMLPYRSLLSCREGWPLLDAIHHTADENGHISMHWSECPYLQLLKSCSWTRHPTDAEYKADCTSTPGCL